jgi:hypothetical protein
MIPQPTASLFECFESTPIALYDMGIADVKERAEKRLVFKNGSAAANFLGYVPKDLYRRLTPGRYLYSQDKSKKYAGRRILK